MNLLKQIEEDKKRILQEAEKIKLAANDKQLILKEVAELKEMARKDIDRIKKAHT